MEKIKNFLKSENGFKIIFIGLFLLLNFLNLYVINSKIYVRDMLVLSKTFATFLSCFFGDLGFLILSLGFAIFIFKSDIRAGKYLIWVTGITSFFMLVISVYYSYYKTFPSIWNLKSFSGDSGGDAFIFLLSSLLTLIRNAQFLFMLPLLILIVVWFVFAHKKIKVSPQVKGHQLIGETKRLYLAFALIVFGIISMVSSTAFYRGETKQKGYEDLKLVAEGVQTIGVVNYYFYEVADYLFFSDKNPTDDKIKNVSSELEKYLTDEVKEELNNKKYKGVFEGKNLLLIQIESMNNFLIGLKVNVNGEIKEVTPNLNRLVKKTSSAYFDNYYTTVGIGNTSDAEFTVLTGLYPTGYSYTVYEYAENTDYETIPKLFNQKGYYSYSSHANIGTFYLRSTLHPTLYGFNEHIDERVLQSVGVYDENRLVHTWVNDVDFLEYNIELMKQKRDELNKSIFNFAITISCHMPYEMSFSDKGLLTDEGKNMFLEKERIFPLGYNAIDEQYMAYLEHASYSDFAIGKALKKLEETGLLEDTVVIMYGDHGCGIDIYNMFYENKDILSNDINDMLEEGNEYQELIERRMLLEVPFIIYDGSETTEFSLEPYHLVRSHNSISRTISNLFNLDNKYSFGVDILSDEVTYGYNPRNMDIILDGVTISGVSKEVCYDKNYSGYPIIKPQDAIDTVLKYKDFNDKVLKYGLFKKNE